jgi:putative DeoR family transcriptional regulator (stage III sporulation protein D)
MLSDLDLRVLTEAQFMLDNNLTVRKTAARFGVSKSTVHKDLSVRLKDIDRNLYLSIKALLSQNLSLRHIRGGAATKRKYEKIKDK